MKFHRGVGFGTEAYACMATVSQSKLQKLSSQESQTALLFNLEQSTIGYFYDALSIGSVALVVLVGWQ